MFFRIVHRRSTISMFYTILVFSLCFDMKSFVDASSQVGNRDVVSHYQNGRHSHSQRAKNFKMFHQRHQSSSDYSNDMAENNIMLRPEDISAFYQLRKVTQSPLMTSKQSVDEGPSFEASPQKQVVTRAGQTASLTCIVKNIGDRQVFWIRGRDLHVLSSGLIVFATDSRVSVSAMESAWTLTISYSQPRDGGAYACQINTQPPIASWLNLTVIEAKANIEGPSTLYVQEGSNISITCVIKEELVIPGLVLWYHGEALVPRDSKRIKVTTKVTNITISHLNISGAKTADSGNYSCWPSSGKQDTVRVHVIQGEPPAAMQHGNSSPSPCLQLRAFLTLITWLTPALIIPGWLT